MLKYLKKYLENYFEKNKSWLIPMIESTLNYIIRIIFHILKFIVVPTLYMIYVLAYLNILIDETISKIKVKWFKNKTFLEYLKDIWNNLRK